MSGSGMKFWTVVAVGVAALLLAGCEGGQNPSMPGRSNDSASGLPPVQSNCVDASQPDVSAPDLYRMIGSANEVLMADQVHSPEDRAMVDAARDAYYQMADTTPNYPWGGIPHNGLALYAREVCDLLPAQYPDRYQRIQQTHGALFTDAVANCETWGQQKGQITDWPAAVARLREKANNGDVSAKTNMLMMKYICPQEG
jgi:hypothetical protein